MYSNTINGGSAVKYPSYTRKVCLRNGISTFWGLFDEDTITTLENRDVLVNNSITANELIILSDETYKENIRNISTIDIDNLTCIQPVKYTMINTKNDKKQHFGFIAQDFEKIYPELVHTKSEKKHINYIELIPILLEKMKQLELRIECLEKNK